MSDYGILGLMICLGTDDLRPLTHHLTANTTTLCVPQRDFDTTLFQYPIWHEKQISTVRNLNSVRSISYLLHYPISQLPHCMLTCSLFKVNRRSNLLAKIGCPGLLYILIITVCSQLSIFLAFCSWGIMQLDGIADWIPNFCQFRYLFNRKMGHPIPINLT